ncbi:MAG: hypothetical protein JNM93_03975 [Bacteriovoracaceae bacterium]|nr:hypothetical protein [Bacteriovoracaceae bacterium]
MSGSILTTGAKNGICSFSTDECPALRYSSVETNDLAVEFYCSLLEINLQLT